MNCSCKSKYFLNKITLNPGIDARISLIVCLGRPEPGISIVFALLFKEPFILCTALLAPGAPVPALRFDPSARKFISFQTSKSQYMYCPLLQWKCFVHCKICNMSTTSNKHSPEFILTDLIPLLRAFFRLEWMRDRKPCVQETSSSLKFEGGTT